MVSGSAQSVTIISYILLIWIIIANIVKITFIGKDTLMTHMMTQTGGKQHQYYICDKIFINNSSLKLHMMKHIGENSCKCSFCKIIYQAEAPTSVWPNSD